MGGGGPIAESVAYAGKISATTNHAMQPGPMAKLVMTPPIAAVASRCIANGLHARTPIAPATTARRRQ